MEVDEEAWASLYFDVSRPFPRPEGERIAVEVMNHFGDELIDVFRVQPDKRRNVVLIYNYGLFWQADAVSWGGRGKSGALTGICPGYRKYGEVDFREQQGIYVLYDDNFRIIYVGQAGAKNSRLFLRLRQHRTDHLAQRWNRFSWFGILPVTDSNVLDLTHEPEAPPVASVLNHIEGILLAAAEPPLNRQSGRFGSDVYQYVQATTAVKDALGE